MSDISPYGVTQHADAEMMTANALVGERAGNVTEHQVGSWFSHASFSTAPYKDPNAHVDKLYNKAMCLGNDKSCRRWPMKGSDYCHLHRPEGA